MTRSHEPSIFECSCCSRTPPEPRRGWRGHLDRFVGPGATRAELWIQFTVALVAALGAPLLVHARGLPWGIARLVLAGLLALDVVGGIATNATSSAKRWYHRAYTKRWNHFAFAALHAIQLILVAVVVRGADWAFFGTYYSLLLVGSGMLLWIPKYLQRPVGLLLFAVLLLIDQYGIPPTSGLEWFIPLFFLKLFISHHLAETAYRPAWEHDSLSKDTHRELT